MASLEERIREIEEEIRRTPYNKATQHHIGRLRAKLARLRDAAERRSAPGRGRGFGIRKSGDATVVLVGFPSVGKSTLLNALTNASSQVGSYDFTTLGVIPGALEHRGARIQVLDLPGLIEGASAGRGRGREVISVLRSADLIVMLISLFHPEQLQVVEEELHRSGIRLNRAPPKVSIKRRSRGGVKISSTVPLTSLDDQTIRSVLAEYRVHNAEVLIREDITVEELIDVLSGHRAYIKALKVVNKIDLGDEEMVRQMRRRMPDAVFISAEKGENIEALKEEIYRALDFIHVYMKPQGGEVDWSEPLILRRGSTIEDVCSKLHRDFKTKFRFARIWGDSVKFEGQRVGLRHVVADGDVVSLVLER